MATKKMAKSGKPSGNLPGLDKLRKFEANPANKAEVAKRAAFADKLKSAMATKQSADSGKVQAMKAQADAAKARQTAKAAPKPAMPARPTGLGAAVRGGAPAPRIGTSGGMGSMAGRGGVGARPAPKGDSFEKVKAAYANENNRINAAKAAGTYKAPEVRGMLGGGGGPPSRPMGGMGMGMKKGGRAKK